MVAASLISAADLVRSQDFDAGLEPGKPEYMAKCASCHGADGKGAGPHAATLKTKPADLTLLAKKNHGVFPVSQVYQLVDGRGSARNHLSDEMPIWGCRRTKPRPLPQTHRRRHSTRTSHKRAPTADFESFMNLACDPEQTIEQRIMSIVAYLSHIQAK
jgi:Cytochrome c